MGSPSDSFNRGRESLGWLFLFFDAISKNAKRESLGGRDRFPFCGPVGHHAGQIGNLGNPASIRLTFGFDFVDDVRHAAILAGYKPWCQFVCNSRNSSGATSVRLALTAPFPSPRIEACLRTSPRSCSAPSTTFADRGSSPT